ncbi:MAG: sialate O-acetylesterase, partial [Verrucomicrobiota bacterium]
PELAFGITAQELLGEPILLIKTAWGGQSLAVHFRSPSSGPYPQTAANARKFDTKEKRKQLEEATGARYRQLVAHVNLVLADIERVYPDYDASQGYELAGFAWFQGFNDLVDRSTYPNRDQPGGYDQYGEWLANLIRDLRRDLNAPTMPFAIGVLGTGGPIEHLEERYQQVHTHFRDAMASPATLPEFLGNVVAVRTGPFWDVNLGEIDKKRDLLRGKARALRSKNKAHENADGFMSPKEIDAFLKNYEQDLFTKEEIALEARGKSNAAYHYLGAATIYSRIGMALARSLLQESGKPPSP